MAAGPQPIPPSGAQRRWCPQPPLPSQHPWPCVTFTLLVAVSSPQSGGLHDDRLPGTDQAVRGGRHGQKMHSGSPPPPRKVDARGGADARSSTEACLS